MDIELTHQKQDVIKLLSDLYGKSITEHEIEKMLNIIPDKDSKRENFYVLSVNTFKEYYSYLYLFDKVYSSKLHQYGEQEALMFSLQPGVKPGIVKEHRIRNSVGRFDNSHDCKDPVAAECDRNIVVIKSETWDSFYDDKRKILYTILVYNKDLVIEKSAI